MSGLYKKLLQANTTVSNRQTRCIEAPLRWLDISMNDIVLMHRMQRGKKRMEVITHIRNHECPVLDPKVGMRKEG